MMIGYLMISAASAFYLFSGKKNGIEMLTCSLPVTRSDIVYARYLAVVVIFSVGLSLWFLNGTIADMIFTNAVTDFSQAKHPKVIFISLFYFSILASIFLPAVFGFRILGMVLTFVIALVVAVASVPLLFHPYSRSFTPYFEASDFYPFMFLSIVIGILLCISFLLSLKIYNYKDL